jgi:transcriptional regulator with XRE-family HTH domain
MKKEEMTIGQRLFSLRRYKNISLKELSEEVCISRSNLNRYERDLSQPTADYIKKLCEYYKVSADYILFGSREEDIKKAGWSIGDPEFMELIEKLYRLMNGENPHMRSWAIVQFSKAFPEEKFI